MKAVKWRTRPISPTCEVLRAGKPGACGRATSYAYPASPAGWMALCDKHAAKHHPHCTHVDALMGSGEQWEGIAPL